MRILATIETNCLGTPVATVGVIAAAGNSRKAADDNFVGHLEWSLQ
mgnify:CR=1 FL=1